MMQQNNANPKTVFVLSAVILLLGIALAAFFMVQQPPEKNAQPAPETAATQEAPEGSARTGTGISPLLAILIFIVILVAATRIGRILAGKRAATGADDRMQ